MTCFSSPQQAPVIIARQQKAGITNASFLDASKAVCSIVADDNDGVVNPAIMELRLTNLHVHCRSGGEKVACATAPLLTTPTAAALAHEQVMTCSAGWRPFF
jgi:hypothetical protein